MSSRFKSRRAKALATVVLLLIAGPLAAAYWTTSGSGTGSATTGTSQPVTISQTGTVTGLYPGGPATSVPFKINNPAPGNQYVTSVTVAITSVVKAAGVSGTCAQADYTVAQPATAVNQDLPPGDTSFTGAQAGTVRLTNTASNQDACKGATVNLSFTSN